MDTDARFRPDVVFLHPQQDIVAGLFFADGCVEWLACFHCEKIGEVVGITEIMVEGRKHYRAGLQGFNGLLIGFRPCPMQFTVEE